MTRVRRLTALRPSEGCVVDIVNHCCKLVACDDEDHLVGVPCLASGRVGGA
jgi:hypothetical protein